MSKANLAQRFRIILRIVKTLTYLATMTKQIVIINKVADNKFLNGNCILLGGVEDVSSLFKFDARMYILIQLCAVANKNMKTDFPK